MHTPSCSHLARLVLAAALGGPLLAQAQLKLSGDVAGTFTDPPSAHTTVYNASDGSYGYIESGQPQHAGASPTMIEFTRQDFTDLGPGLVADNLFKVTNGRNLLGTTADAATFDLTFDVTAPDPSSHPLVIPFTINNTANEPNGQNVDDVFRISAGSIAPFDVGNTRVQLTFNAPASFSVPENETVEVGSLSMRFTPIPEAATFAWGGAALLLGFVGFHLLSRRKLPRAAAVVS